MFTFLLNLFTNQLFVYIFFSGDKYWDEHNTDDILDLPSLDDNDLDSEPIDIKVEPEVNNRLTGSESADRNFVSEIEEKVENNDIFLKNEEENTNETIENEFKPEPIISNEPVTHKCTDCDESFTLINDLR